MDKKNLSAARKKLEEYKLSKTASGRESSSSTFIEVNETSHPLPQPDAVVSPTSFSHYVPPPPTESIPTFLNNLGQELQAIHSGGQQEEIKVLNVTPFQNNSDFPELNNSSTFISSSSGSSPTLDGGNNNHNNNNASIISPFSEQEEHNKGQYHHVLLTPTAPILFDQQQEHSQHIYNQKEEAHFTTATTDAGHSFPPVNFFQSTPISQDYQQQILSPSSNSPYEPQDFYYGQQQQQPPSPPLFFNVNGDSITPHLPLIDNNSSYLPPSQEQQQQFVSPQKEQGTFIVPNQASTINMDDNSLEPAVPALYPVLQTETLNGNENNNDDNDNLSSSSNKQDQLLSSPFPPTTKTVQFNLLNEDLLNSDNNNIISEEQIVKDNLQHQQSPTPSLQEEINVQEQLQAMQRLKSVQDALELQLEELRRDNERLLTRQSELISQIDSNEKNIQELRHERDSSKEQQQKSLQPLHARINTLCEENQRTLKNSSEVGMELRSKLQEKAKQYEDMEHAFIIVSKSKMDLAAELDQEREKSKDLESQILSKDNDIVELRSTVAKLEDKLKVEQQKDVIIHQLEDQIRHYQVQSETLSRELNRSNNKIERLLVSSGVTNNNQQQAEVVQDNHIHGENCHHGQDSHSHSHSHSHDDHHDHSHDHSHSHDDQDHSHDHDHSEHDHHHDHEHHEHGQATFPEHEGGARRPSLSQEDEMKRRLHHLEWENSTFRLDLEKLAVEAKERRTFEEKFNKMSEDCEEYQKECQRLEHLVVQLQGENDTIGDYITLYQSQRLALKESAREQDLQLTNLSKERESLLMKMEELSELLKVVKQQKLSMGGDENAGNQTIHQPCTHQNNGDKGDIEGKIRNLLSEISSSSNLIENFHPCAVCSGQLKVV